MRKFIFIPLLLIPLILPSQMYSFNITQGAITKTIDEEPEEWSIVENQKHTGIFNVHQNGNCSLILNLDERFVFNPITHIQKENTKSDGVSKTMFVGFYTETDGRLATISFMYVLDGNDCRVDIYRPGWKKCVRYIGKYVVL